jgi:hypothetical protein
MDSLEEAVNTRLVTVSMPHLTAEELANPNTKVTILGRSFELWQVAHLWDLRFGDKHNDTETCKSNRDNNQESGCNVGPSDVLPQDLIAVSYVGSILAPWHDNFHTCDMKFGV